MPPHRRLTKAQKDRIVVLAKQGVPRKYIAERFGITYSTVRTILKQGVNDGKTPID